MQTSHWTEIERQEASLFKTNKRQSKVPDATIIDLRSTDYLNLRNCRDVRYLHFNRVTNLRGFESSESFEG